MLEIESNYEYINGILMGNVLDFQAQLANGTFTSKEKEVIAEELKSTAQMFAQQQGLWYLGAQVEAYPSGDGVRFENNATDIYGRYYAGHVEYGHWDRGHKRFIPARPFMRPALYTVARASIGRVDGSMKHYLDAMWSLTPLQFGRYYGASKSYTRAFYKGERGGEKVGVGKYTTTALTEKKTFSSDVRSSSFRDKYSIVRGGHENDGYTRVSNHWTRG